MFPQHIDLEFHYWRLWSGRLKERPGAAKQVPTIDDVINAHARTRWTRSELTAHNLQIILRNVSRRGGSVRAKLEELSANPNTMIDPQKRAAFARKWLLKLDDRRTDTKKKPMKIRVTFEIEISEVTLAKNYGDEFVHEYVRTLRGEPVDEHDAERLRLLAWDTVVGANGHGFDPDKREMRVELVK